MHEYINISELNDFIFCPYSIYIHHIYDGVDKGLYYSEPQIVGTYSHESVDKKTYTKNKDYLMSLPIWSDNLSIMGKIDVYKISEKLLVERKYKLNKIYRGQLYQLWAQAFCMEEMGYTVNEVAFYEISANKKHIVDKPGKYQYMELLSFIKKFKDFDGTNFIQTNMNKCSHCIYKSLCDKTTINNVF